jgi:hypothetical protein
MELGIFRELSTPSHDFRQNAGLVVRQLLCID